jgi:uncharacterized tellurite resistance protein B-like protein
MSTETSKGKHPATKLPLQERVDYMTVVAAMAAADGELAATEVDSLRKACHDLGLGPREMGEVIAAAERPDEVHVKQVVARLRSSDLRFTLMTDLFFMAYADDKLVEAEKHKLGELADALSITKEQRLAIKKYVEAVRKAATAQGVSAEELKQLGGTVAASLGSAGIPIAAVAVLGVPGLSAAGITSGLAALGLGLGMASGIGVAVAIGVGSFFGIRWLYKKLVGA